MNLVGIGLEEIGYEFGENELLIRWGMGYYSYGYFKWSQLVILEVMSLLLIQTKNEFPEITQVFWVPQRAG